MTNTARIEKDLKFCREQALTPDGRKSDEKLLPLSVVENLLEGVKKHLPPQISREAVKELREKHEKLSYGMFSVSLLRAEFLKGLDILLSQQQQDGDR